MPPRFSIPGLASYHRQNTTSASSSTRHGKAQPTTWWRLKQKRCASNRLRPAKRPRKRSEKKTSGDGVKKTSRGESCLHQLLLEALAGLLPAVELAELVVEQG
jgi:hypothetical protein